MSDKLIRDLQFLGGVPKEGWVKIDHNKKVNEMHGEEMPADSMSGDDIEMKMDMGDEEMPNDDMGEEKKMETCPFCGEEVECGKLEEHIREHHADIVKMHGHKDDEEDMGMDREEKPEITGDEEVDVRIPMESEEKEEKLAEESRELRWKQTSLSPEEAIKKHGKDNVKVTKGGLSNGDDMVEVRVPLHEAASASGTMMFSDMPSTMHKDQPKDEEKFDMPADIMKQLRDCVSFHKDQAKHFEVLDNDRSMFHQKVIEVAEEIIRLLSKRDEMCGKEAAVYLTSLQSSLQHALPADLWSFMAADRPMPSLKDYFNVAKRGK